VLGDRGRALVRKAELGSGLRPRVNQRLAHTVTFPEGRRAALVIAADLELAWAWRYAQMPNPRRVAYRKALNGRRNVGVLLDLCEAYQVPITWDTIGHLFLDSCTRTDDRAHPELARIPYFTNEQWMYRTGDWFDCDPCLTIRDDVEWPAWYAPDLIEAILSRRTPHEIGSHSFSHVPFDETICPPEVVEGELGLCREVATRWGLDLRTFVFPGNMHGHAEILAANGFQSYRAIAGTKELDLPRRDSAGLWAMPAGVCLDRAYNCWSARDHFESIRRFVDVAIDTGLLCSLWFHPEEEPAEVDALFPQLFAYLESRRSDLWITTTSGLVRWLDDSSAQQVGRGEEVGSR
jgi:peptidoglycan/xylan/chitin deacetylase (PgdA/CDA1 family)